ncbi:MAG: DUF4393 domain-containing protein [Myxococcales bacterium]|nr:DUF4393 domain-containing protein [Myxococcales bacterium]
MAAIDSSDNPEGGATTPISAVAAMVPKSVKSADKYAEAIVSDVGEVASRATSLLLAPLKALIWSGERLQHWIETAVAPRLASIPSDRRQTPPAKVAVPLLQAMTYSDGEAELENMFAELLAAAMDSAPMAAAHPAYVEVIKQMTAVEALLLKKIVASGDVAPLVRVRQANYSPSNAKRILNGASGPLIVAESEVFASDHITNHVSESEIVKAAVALDNLERLGVIVISYSNRFAQDEVYREVELVGRKVIENTSSVVEGFGLRPDGSFTRLELTRGTLRLTAFGRLFCRACLPSERS